MFLVSEMDMRTSLRLWPLAEPLDITVDKKLIQPRAGCAPAGSHSTGVGSQASSSVPGCPGQLAFQAGQICAYSQ